MILWYEIPLFKHIADLLNLDLLLASLLNSVQAHVMGQFLDALLGQLGH